jgi:hypothetical protein
MLRLLSLVALLSALLLPGPAVAQDSGKLMLAVLEFSNDAGLTPF